MGLADLLTGDNYRDYVLPALGVVEAIATKGRSPGAAAFGQMQAFDKSKDDVEAKARQSRLDAQTAAKDALQTRLGGLQIDNAEHEKLAGQKRDAAIQALSGKLGDTPEKQAFYNAYPETYAQQLKPEQTQIVLGADNQYHAIGKKNAMDVGTGDAVTAAPKHDPNAVKPLTQSQKNTETLRLRSMNLKENTDYETQARAFQKVMSAKDRGSISDVALLDNFVKANTSGVPTHEQYQATLGSVGLGQLADKVIANQNGNYLTPEKRQQIRDVLKDEFSASHARHKATNEDYKSSAKNMGLNPDDVVHSSEYEKQVEKYLQPSISDEEIIKQAMGGN